MVHQSVALPLNRYTLSAGKLSSKRSPNVLRIYPVTRLSRLPSIQASRASAAKSIPPPLLLPELELPPPVLPPVDEAATSTDVDASTVEIPSDTSSVKPTVLPVLWLGAVKATEASDVLDNVTEGPDVCVQL